MCREGLKEKKGTGILMATGQGVNHMAAVPGRVDSRSGMIHKKERAKYKKRADPDRNRTGTV